MRYELIKTTINPVRWFWWKFIPGTIVEFEIISSPDNIFKIVDWFELNVGPHRTMWDWRFKPTNNLYKVIIVVKIHKKKEHLSTIALLLLQ